MVGIGSTGAANRFEYIGLVAFGIQWDGDLLGWSRIGKHLVEWKMTARTALKQAFSSGDLKAWELQ